jgi:glutamate/tyrosine decarboxylase-like PLP-dependent enzyme
MLGLGSGRVIRVPADDQGRMRADALALDGPAIVIAQAGEVNTGAIDPLGEITAQAREHGAWCHVDGAFGLWAAASPALRGLVAGAQDADSWATDGHKWLNVPYDRGVAVVRDAGAHLAAMNPFHDAAYIPPAERGQRYSSSWVPEFSRRARGFTVYAALRELGRGGLADLIERSCAHARLMASLLEAAGLEVLNEVVLNQVLVRCSEATLHAVQDEGTCWMSGTTWAGGHAMRISICNWRTTEDDIRRSAAAILAEA